MITEKRITKGHAKVMLGEELTIYTAGELKERFEKYTDPDKCRSMTIDMSEVVEIDTSCMQVLMQLKLDFKNTERELKIVSQSPAVIEVFELYNLGEFFW